MTQELPEDDGLYIIWEQWKEGAAFWWLWTLDTTPCKVLFMWQCCATWLNYHSCWWVSGDALKFLPKGPALYRQRLLWPAEFTPMSWSNWNNGWRILALDMHGWVPSSRHWWALLVACMPWIQLTTHYNCNPPQAFYQDRPFLNGYPRVLLHL